MVRRAIAGDGCMTEKKDRQLSKSNELHRLGEEVEGKTANRF